MASSTNLYSPAVVSSRFGGRCGPHFVSRLTVFSSDSAFPSTARKLYSVKTAARHGYSLVHELGGLSSDYSCIAVRGQDDEYDLDCPTKGFSSIAEAIEDIRQGKTVVVVDDEDRENEGDLIMAASLVSPQALAFIVKHGTGIVCVSMKGEDLERLQLPLMVTPKENEEKLSTAFTVSVDAKYGTTTGVSARDRTTTILALASKDSKPEDFCRPGHIFPLKYREGGVLKRAGHTEASLDLAVLAGLEPAAVLSEIVDEDGSMARLPKLQEFSREQNLKIISIADLIRYRRKREKLVELTAAAPIPTTWGPFKAYCFKSVIDGIEHIAMVKGDIGDGKDILVRVHSECLAGDIFGSARCDCGKQLALAMHQVEVTGRGVLVYLRGLEGRGVGFDHKLRPYCIDDSGQDSADAIANEQRIRPVDSREYGIGSQILRDLGVRTMRLMTNNPAAYTGLKGYGLEITGKVPLIAPSFQVGNGCSNGSIIESVKDNGNAGVGSIYDSGRGMSEDKFQV